MGRFHSCFHGNHGGFKVTAKWGTAPTTEALFYSRIFELGMKIDRPFDEMR